MRVVAAIAACAIAVGCCQRPPQAVTANPELFATVSLVPRADGWLATLCIENRGACSCLLDDRPRVLWTLVGDGIADSGEFPSGVDLAEPHYVVLRPVTCADVIRGMRTPDQQFCWDMAIKSSGVGFVSGQIEFHISDSQLIPAATGLKRDDVTLHVKKHLGINQGNGQKSE